MDTKYILLVEDNPDDEALTIRALRRHQLANRVVVARDGMEALAFLHRTGTVAGRAVDDRPAVVLLDLNLPRLSGLEVLQRIRGDIRTRLLPVVVLTTSDEERDLVESYRLGANSYVRKPVDFTAFSETVRQLGQYWLTLNQTPRWPG